MLAVSNKGYEVSLRWDDRINDNLSYWVGNYSNKKNELKRTLLFLLCGGDLGNKRH
jgi:hypothetical protein